MEIVDHVITLYWCGFFSIVLCMATQIYRIPNLAAFFLTLMQVQLWKDSNTDFVVVVANLKSTKCVHSNMHKSHSKWYVEKVDSAFSWFCEMYLYGAWKKEASGVDLGWVLRDDHGSVLWLGTRTLRTQILMLSLRWMHKI